MARLGAQRAMTAVVLSCAVLTYGGVSVFVPLIVLAVMVVGATLGVF